MTGNALATLALATFPIVACLVFARAERARALAIVVLAGSAFLPEMVLVEIGGVVSIGKDRIVYISALIGALIFHRRFFVSSRPGLGLEILLLFMLFGSLWTWRANLGVVVNESAIQAPLSFQWVIGQTIDDFFNFALPFVIGRCLLRSLEDLKSVLNVLLVVGIIYSALIAIELVMAIPFRVFQLSHYIYDLPGRTQFRFGLTEPTMFFGKGHALATFMLLPAVGSAGFAKLKRTGALSKPTIAAWLPIVGLVMTMKVGAMLSGLSAKLAFVLLSPRRIAGIAVLLSIGVCVYPFLRVVDIFPYEVLVDASRYLGEERARSFGGRFDEENYVLEISKDRLLTGWGTFARIPDAYSYGAASGEPGLDAWWVIRTGMAGLIGVQLVMLLCVIPVIRARKLVINSKCSVLSIFIVVLMLCVSLRMLDLLLNGWWNSLPVFLAGVLQGCRKSLTTGTTGQTARVSRNGLQKE